MGLFKSKRLYRKSLLIFVVLLSTLSLVFLGYVYKSMVIYERNLVDNYIEYLASSGKLAEGVSNDLFNISEYEKKNAKISDGYKKILKDKNIIIKKNRELSNDNVIAYDLKLNNRIISTVSLKSVKKYRQMAILTINEWDVVEHKTYIEDGIYSYKINVPENYKVVINNHELQEPDSVGDVEGLDRVTKYVSVSKNKTYNINNLVYKPDITILDNSGNNVKYTINEEKIIVTKEFIKVASEEEAKQYLKEDFDVLKLAENWSLFLTDDLNGSWHGLFKLTPYLIEESYMYNMAYNWSHGEDIRFVSNHRLKNPVFTNESVKNFTIYNENVFSCEVYLEKNMIVSGKTKVDTMHDRLYFVYYDGGYKLVDMQSIEE